MSRRRILIVAGSDAGTSAALSARSLDPDCDVDVLLEDRFPNFSVCGLPFLLSGEVAAWADLAHRSEEDFAHRRITLHKEHRAVSVRNDRREVVVATAAGERTFGYDRLVIATGAEAVTPKIAGAELPGVHDSVPVSTVISFGGPRPAPTRSSTWATFRPERWLSAWD